MTARPATVVAVCALGAGLVSGAPAGAVAEGKPSSARTATAAVKAKGAPRGAVRTRAWRRGRAVAARGGLAGPKVPPPGTPTVTVTGSGPPVATPPATPGGGDGTTTSAGPAPATPVPVRRSGAELTEYAVRLTRAVLDAGTIEVTATNYGMDEHDLTLSRAGVVLAQTPVLQAQEAATLTADVTPGTYRLYCSLLNGAHDDAGMNATLTVR